MAKFFAILCGTLIAAASFTLGMPNVVSNQINDGTGQREMTPEELAEFYKEMGQAMQEMGVNPWGSFNRKARSILKQQSSNQINDGNGQREMTPEELAEFYKEMEQLQQEMGMGSWANSAKKMKPIQQARSILKQQSSNQINDGNGQREMTPEDLAEYYKEMAEAMKEMGMMDSLQFFQ